MYISSYVTIARENANLCRLLLERHLLLRKLDEYHFEALRNESPLKQSEGMVTRMLQDYLGLFRGQLYYDRKFQLVDSHLEEAFKRSYAVSR